MIGGWLFFLKNNVKLVKIWVHFIMSSNLYVILGAPNINVVLVYIKNNCRVNY